MPRKTGHPLIRNITSTDHQTVEITKHTPGPYSYRIYATDDDPEELRKLGLKPVRMLTNEGQIAIVAGEGDDKTRVALVDCQVEHKRGQGYKTDCPRRDANAQLFAAAPEMLKELQRLHEKYGHQSTADIIAQATGTP